MIRRFLWAGAAAGALWLAGCAGDKPKPTPLESLTPKIAGRQVWNARLDAIGFPLAVSVSNGHFIVAGGDGTVLSLEAASGREVWRGSAGDRLSAGVGSDGRYAAVVTRGNQLVVLDRGGKLWSTRLNTRVVTPPLVAGERVFVMGVDRVVRAYDVLDGRFLWVHQRQGEPLALAQPGVVAPFKDTLLVGQGAALVGLDPTRGSVRWEATLASPRGTNEVERLTDLVGPLLRVGDAVCVRSFQSAVGCIVPEGATVRWARPIGGAQALGGDDAVVVGADASDRVRAWKAGNGDLAWTHERFLHRGLSAPLSAGRTVIFGDAEGQVHFLDRDTGETLLRLATDGSAVAAPPVKSGTTMLVVTRNGGLFAFRPE